MTREAFRVAFADAVRDESDPVAIRAIACRMLGEHLDVQRVAYAELGGDEDATTDSELTADERAMLAGAGGAAVLAIGVVRGGRWVAILSVQSRTPRAWSPDEQELLRETGERTWLAIDRALRERALREVAARDAYRARLHDALRGLDDPAAVIGAATRMLGEQLGVQRAVFVELVGDIGVIQGDYCNGVASIVGMPQPIRSSFTRDAMSCGRAFAVEDVDTDARFSDEARAHYRTIEIRAFAAVGIVKNGQWVAALGVHSTVPRAWTPEEIRIVEDAVEPTWAALGLARAMVALRDIDRRKNEFLALLSHELRNPLAPLRTAVEVLELGAGQPSIVDAMRQLMARQLDHMTHLIDDLLDGARMTRGTIVLRRVPTTLEEIVTTAVDANRVIIASRELRLELSLIPSTSRIMVDATRMVQALSNLLHNAAKFTPAGGCISVAAGIHDDQLMVAVTDTGVGFRPDLAPRLFDIFVQGDDGLGRAHGGLGIGLALSRHIVELHGGTITATSDGPGCGARFEIRVPASQASAEYEVPGDPAVLRKRTIVIVDDNRDAAKALSLLVTALGGEAHVAHDGASGIALVREHMPDVVFLDIGMPMLDGYEVCRRLRSEIGDTLEIIALTGWGKDEDKRRAREAGFDDHLTKPADPKQLRRIVTG